MLKLHNVIPFCNSNKETTPTLVLILALIKKQNKTKNFPKTFYALSKPFPLEITLVHPEFCLVLETDNY